MKTNRYFAIAVVTVLIFAAVWVVAEAKVKQEPSVKSSLTSEDYENLFQIVLKARVVHKITNQIDILKGLGAINVLVEGFKPEVERLGLTRQTLQTDVELLLRKYGIEVDKSNMFNCLYINVAVLPSDLGFVAYSITVEFCDAVIPVRNPTIRIIDAIVWKTGSVGLATKKNIRDIREGVEDDVKKFINDYLAANPKDKKVGDI